MDELSKDFRLFLNSGVAFPLASFLQSSLVFTYVCNNLVCCQDWVSRSSCCISGINPVKYDCCDFNLFSIFFLFFVFVAGLHDYWSNLFEMSKVMFFLISGSFRNVMIFFLSEKYYWRKHNELVLGRGQYVWGRTKTLSYHSTLRGTCHHLDFQVFI